MVAGNYADPAFNLPGASLDLARALEIAKWLGADDRVQVLQDGGLTLQSMDTALSLMAQQAQPDETVFIYFSGHGRQIDGGRFGARCSEGLVMPAGHLYLDQAVMYHLQRAAKRARQVLMFSDACHAGGLATKQFRDGLGGPPTAVAKVYKGDLRGVADAPPGTCGYLANKQMPMLRGGSTATGTWLHVAAAAPDEAAWATPQGSQATQAWHAALALARQQGWLDGVALRQDAQRQIDGLPHRQTVTLAGDAARRWPLR